MKAIKNIFAILMAVALLCSLGVTAFADDTPTYTITINNAVAGQTYSAYKIFDVTKDVTSNEYIEVANGKYYKLKTGTYTLDAPTTENENQYESTTKKYAQKGYSYTIDAENTTWLPVVLNYMEYTKNGDSWEKDGSPEAFSFKGKGMSLTLSADGTKYIVATDGDFNAADFAIALKTALQNTTTPMDPTPDVAATETASGEPTARATLSVEKPGYYFVNSNVGALGILGTTANTLTVNEKNTLPNIEKKVWEDDNNGDAHTTEGWSDSAVLDVVDTVHYQLTVSAGKGADANYIIEDTLPNGFTYKENSIAVSCTVTDPQTWEKDTDYTIGYAEQVLTINLIAPNGKLAGLNDTDQIVITYDATMNKSATGDQVDYTATGNTNTVTLKYKTVERGTDSAIVKTYQIGDLPSEDVVEFKKEDGTTHNALVGVEFVLSKEVTTDTGEGNTTTTYYAKVTDGYLTGWTTYLKNSGNDPEGTTYASNIVTNNEGTFTVKGLDAGEYTLTETETLPGYNLLTDTIMVKVEKNGTVSYKMTSAATYPDNSNSIKVENNTGTELPETGGIGTTIFTVVGAALMIGAAVLLITKKRMNGTSD